MTALLTNQQNSDWQQRLAIIVGLMRGMSRHSDPQEMVRAYAEGMRQLLPIGRRGSHELRLELKDPRDERWSEVGSYPFTIDHLVSALPPTP